MTEDDFAKAARAKKVMVELDGYMIVGVGRVYGKGQAYPISSLRGQDRIPEEPTAELTAETIPYPLFH